MEPMDPGPLKFERQTIIARLVEPSGDIAERTIEVRTHPITGRTCRISYSRINEKEAGADTLPTPPPDAENTGNCPFCRPQVSRLTPRLHPGLSADAERLVCGESLLFPNLYPYGAYSAVSLISNDHFVEIGAAEASSYTDCLINCRQYLANILTKDPGVIYMAITQNHLPSAGGSLVHPHLQINADRIASNHHRILMNLSGAYYRKFGARLLSDYLKHELSDGRRIIGTTGPWHWLAAFAPEGFYEIWAILPGITSMQLVEDAVWADLSAGIVAVQKYYRSLNRNGYNLGLLAVETPQSALELRCRMTVRSNYAPWVRNDYTGFEIMLGDMTTFTAPEQIAATARAFFNN